MEFSPCDHASTFGGPAVVVHVDGKFSTVTKNRVSNCGRHPALLVVGHPGHELRVYGWMAKLRPDVVILTDGSGHTEHARTESSRRLVREVGASATHLFGTLRDADVYRALREHRFEILDAMILGVTA